MPVVFELGRGFENTPGAPEEVVEAGLAEIALGVYGKVESLINGVIGNHAENVVYYGLGIWFEFGHGVARAICAVFLV